jgi:aryl-alcohol dehydrogenase-like predicted oxidoreductase
MVEARREAREGRYRHQGRKGLAKPYILSAAEDSLKRLQTDYIDLYQSHSDDPATHLDETLEAYPAILRGWYQ